MSTIVTKAWETGQKIDLSGVGYGRIHWGNQKDVRDGPSPYYYLLAGFVRQYNFSRIFEIGTHWGGATRAMYRGMLNPHLGKVVTVDITTESDNRLKDYPDIVKIVGDGNTEEVFTEVLTVFDHKPVWPAAGFVDTEIRCLTELESGNAKKEVQPRVQA